MHRLGTTDVERQPHNYSELYPNVSLIEMKYPFCFLALAAFSLLPVGECQAFETSDPDSELNQVAIQAVNILVRTCGRCHKGSGSSFFDAKRVSTMVDEGYLTEGDHESSYLFERMFDGTMPPKNRPELPRPSGVELDVVKQWINTGAVAPVFPQRPRTELTDELEAVLSYLKSVKSRDVPYIRFFSLRNLSNQPSISEQQLSFARLALAKAVNSLSWQPDIVEMIPVSRKSADGNANRGLLFAIDIRDVGWTSKHWKLLLNHYPYAVGFESHQDPELDVLDTRIKAIRRTSEPAVIRADWFVAVATSPPIYHSLLFDLFLPSLLNRKTTGDAANPKRMNAIDLEQHLGVNVEENIRQGVAKRVGYTESGISGQNRMFEYHPIPHGGAYWKSYDFLDSNRTAVLTEFPFGPRFDGNPYPELAFDHDGGEIIFNLPNGLQGYLLVDRNGNRIDAGPIEVVADSLRTSGNEQIVTGLSCMACHRNGMIASPEDEVRPFAHLVGEPRKFLQELYVDSSTMNQLLDRSSALFVESLQKAVSHVSTGIDVAALPEPVGEIARHHLLEPMTIETVASELDVSVAELREAIKHRDALQAMGLRVLLRDGGSIKRAAWESPLQFPMMKEAAREFGFSPVN